MIETRSAVLEQVKELMQAIDALKDERAAIGEQIRDKQRVLHDLVLTGGSSSTTSGTGGD